MEEKSKISLFFARLKKSLRRNLKRGSLFRKYFNYTASLIMVCLLSLGFIMMMAISVQWWNDKVDTLMSNAREIENMISEEYENNIVGTQTGVRILSNTLDIMCQATNSDYFITDTEGNVTLCKGCVDFMHASECATHSVIKVTDNYMVKALDKGFADYTADEVFGVGQFVVAVPINVSGEIVGSVFAVEDAITGLVPYVLGVAQIFFYSVLGCLLLCFIVLYILCRNITGPISEMQEVTRHFAKGEFNHRANEDYDSEYLREFAKSLNKMADELANDEEAQRSFVANVSHELKTPMTTIGGFIDGMLDGTIKPEQQKGYLEIVSNEIKRLSRMVVSMLNLSKIQSGEVSLSAKKYDISSQIFQTLLLFEKKINEKSIEIDGLEEMGSVSINADKDLVQQVIYNLLDNAVKFTPEKGKITVFASRTDDVTCVKIRNTGRGISENEISRIFERFYKVDKSRSYDVKGVGLGLYIVKTIINMHDGEITASSVPGEYTEFAFEIPD